MARTTVLFGALMIVLGLAGYFGTGEASLTALIPAAFGVVLAVLGGLSFDDRRRKQTMHAAAALGLLGLLVALQGLLFVEAGSAARLAQVVMAVLMAAFIALCVRSFVAARKARALQGR